MLKTPALALMITIGCLSPGAASAQAQPQTRNATQADGTVRRLADALADAIVARDADAMNRLLADDFVDVNPDGAISTRAQFIAEYRTPPATANTFQSAEFDAEATVVRVHGDVALLTGRSTWRGQTANGQPFAAVLVTSMAALERDGQWRIASTHSSSVPPPQSAEAASH